MASVTPGARGIDNCVYTRGHEPSRLEDALTGAGRSRDSSPGKGR